METKPERPRAATKAKKSVSKGKRRSPAQESGRAKAPAVAKKHGSVVDVKKLCRRFRVVRSTLTRMTGYSQRAVDNWAAGQRPGAPVRKQLTELSRLFHALADIMEPEYVGEWLNTSNPAFDGSTPLQVIERGETDRIWRMVYQVETGEPV